MPAAPLHHNRVTALGISLVQHVSKTVGLMAPPTSLSNRGCRFFLEWIDDNV